MDKAHVPVAYAQGLTERLAGHDPELLLELFTESAVVERYVLGEKPRSYSGLEQIEESLLRMPPIGGSFHVTDVRVEESTVHARFHTHDFPYPMRGLYRFELDASGRIIRLYISARYSPSTKT
jgi:hypothetical protein